MSLELNNKKLNIKAGKSRFALQTLAAEDFPTVAQATEAFNALADGGKVSMTLQPMYWAKIWGMLTDKFGTPWMVNGELQAVYPK